MLTLRADRRRQRLEMTNRNTTNMNTQSVIQLRTPLGEAGDRNTRKMKYAGSYIINHQLRIQTEDLYRFH